MENTQNIVLGVEINYQYKMDILFKHLRRCLIITSVESYKHKIAKELVFNWLINKQSNILNLPEPIYYQEFGCCEAILYDKDGITPFHNWMSCECCKKYEKTMVKKRDKTIEYAGWFKILKLIKKHNLLIREIPYVGVWGGYYKQHPCWICPFRCRKFYLIYDIAFAREGGYSFAIEIKHQHYVSKDKINKSPIPIFEIDAEWVLSQIEPPKNLKGKWL